MPVECLYCPHLHGQSKEWGAPYICDLFGGLVNPFEGECGLLPVVNRIRELLPLERVRCIVMSENGQLEFDVGNLDIENVAGIGDFITRTKRWDFTHSELMGQVIVILGFSETDTQYGDALLADCLVDGLRKVVLVGGTVLIEQLKEVQAHLPLRAVIEKPKKTYIFRSPPIAEKAPEPETASE